MIHSKLVRDLIPGDVLILDTNEKVTVTSSRRSGVFETPTGVAYEIHWKTETGEKSRQLAPPDAKIRVEGGAS